MVRLRTALVSAAFVLAAVGLLGRIAERHDGAGGLLGAFVAAIVLGSSYALALVLADAVGSGRRRPHAVPAAASPSARGRRRQDPAS